MLKRRSVLERVQILLNDILNDKKRLDDVVTACETKVQNAFEQYQQTKSKNDEIIKEAKTEIKQLSKYENKLQDLLKDN